jgi:hypothetical protein
MDSPGFFSRLKEKGTFAKDVWGVIGSALSVRDLMMVRIVIYSFDLWLLISYFIRKWRKLKLKVSLTRRIYVLWKWMSPGRLAPTSSNTEHILKLPTDNAGVLERRKAGSHPGSAGSCR